MNVLLIGIATGPGIDPAKQIALYPVPEGSAGHRLQVLSGLSKMGYLTTYSRMNLLPFCPEKGLRKVHREAAQAIAQLVTQTLDPRLLVLVGSDVQRAFFGETQAPCSVRPWHVHSCWCIPHPSGRNPWYNIEANKKQVAEGFMQINHSLAQGHTPDECAQLMCPSI